MPDVLTTGLSPAPYIAISLVDLNPACATVTAYRIQGRRTSPVRAAIRVPAAGGVNIIDWQAPLGVTVTYRAEQFDQNGYSLGFTTPISGRVDDDRTWIHNPLDPSSAVAVELGRGTAAEIDRPHDLELTRASGRPLVSAVSGQRGGVTGSPLIFYTLTDEDADRVLDAIGNPYDDLTGPPILCIRTPAAFNVPWPASFIAAVELTAQPVNQHAGLQTTRWTGTATEAEEPAIGLVVAVLAYDDLDAAYPSYDAMDAAYLTYLERDRQYQLAAIPDPGGGGSSSGYGAGSYGDGPYGT